MKMINTIEEYKDEILEFKKKCGRKYDTNLYLSAREIENMIDNKRMFCIKYAGQLWFLIKDRGFWIAYYYVEKDRNLVLEPLCENVLVEIMGDARIFDNRRGDELVANVGFIKHDKNLQAIITEPKKEYIKTTNAAMHEWVESHGYEYREANYEDYDVVSNLWEKRIDKYAIRLLSSNKEIMKGTTVICDGNEIIACKSIYRNCNNELCPAHLVVNKRYSGLGFGWAMTMEIYDKLFDMGVAQIKEWISDKNNSSLKLHEKIANFTGKFCQEYVLKGTCAIE